MRKTLIAYTVQVLISGDPLKGMPRRFQIGEARGNDGWDG